MNELGDRIGSGGLSAAGMQVEKLLELGRSIAAFVTAGTATWLKLPRTVFRFLSAEMASGLLAPNCEIAVFSWLCAW